WSSGPKVPPSLRAAVFLPSHQQLTPSGPKVPPLPSGRCFISVASGSRDERGSMDSTAHARLAEHGPMSKPLFLFAHGAGAPSASAWMQAWSERLGRIGRVRTFDYPYKIGRASCR